MLVLDRGALLSTSVSYSTAGSFEKRFVLIERTFHTAAASDAYSQHTKLTDLSSVQSLKPFLMIAQFIKAECSSVKVITLGLNERQ